MAPFTFWYKILVGFCVFCIIVEALRLIFKEKFINSFNKLPDNKRKKLRKKYSISIKLEKIMLFMAPLNLLLLPYLLYSYSPKHFLSVTIIVSMTYILTIENFFFDLSMLKGLKKPIDSDT